MIKKLFSLIIAVVMIFSLAACSNKELDTTDRSTNLEQKEIKNEQYSLAMETFQKNNVNVQFPQIKGLGDDEREKTINDLIKNHMLEEIVQIQDSARMEELTLELTCLVTMHTQEVLSVLYTGYSCIEGPGSIHPFKRVFAITIDLENGSKLKLTDFTEINEGLVEKIKKSTDVTNQSLEDGMDKKHLLGDIQAKDNETIMEGLREEWTFYVFAVKPDGLIISIGIVHAAGDYALITISD